MTQTGTVRIGISGWTYPPWRGVFYPKGVPHARELWLPLVWFLLPR